jgi:DNA-binding NtrC family response regulator
VTLQVPPLRERPEDIARLAEHFLKTLRLPGTVQRRFSPSALAALRTYSWPGNVRELRNVVERLVLLSPETRDETIGEAEVAAVLAPARPMQPAGQGGTGDSLEEAEKAHIQRVLAAHGGNKTQTARTLHIDYKTLLAKLRRYNVEPE